MVWIEYWNCRHESTSLALCPSPENGCRKTHKLGDKLCAALEGQLVYFGLILLLFRSSGGHFAALLKCLRRERCRLGCSVSEFGCRLVCLLRDVGSWMPFGCQGMQAFGRALKVRAPGSAESHISHATPPHLRNDKTKGAPKHCRLSQEFVDRTMRKFGELAYVVYSSLPHRHFGKIIFNCDTKNARTQAHFRRP